MSGFRVYMRSGGWRVTNGSREHGPYPTYQQALQAAENLNLQLRAEEERSFAPVEPEVWEAVEEPAALERNHEDRLAREAIDRARVGGSDTPAAGPASEGGGVV